MWVLFVMSMVGDGEARITFYNDYDSQEKCQISARSLTSEFTEGEKALCYFVEYLKPKMLDKVQEK